MNKLTYFDIHSLNSEKPKVFDWACSSYAETEDFYQIRNADREVIVAVSGNLL
ncbi:MAG: hypothetical protein OSB72_03805 [Gammaproteobacteria bacterium]|jgi:hypothetical protein|nr:hypothetical protein [Gammaproteobacteria bacterium]